MGLSQQFKFMDLLVAKYLSTDMRKQLFGKCINQGSKTSVIIDVASTVSHKIVLIIYLNVKFKTLKIIQWLLLIS